MPIGDPASFAFDFYAQYPALTILFYPPLFYALSAPFILLFGESQAVVQAVVAIHLFALGVGGFALARMLAGRWFALAAALLLLGMAEIALWGRQVMLEIPALAFLVWAAVFALRFARDGGTAALAATVLLLLAALYTKISMAFVVPALVLAVMVMRGWPMLRDRRVWVALLVGLLGLLPRILLTLKFGQANVQSVVAIADTPASRNTLAGWTWYAGQLPRMAGWPVLLLAAVGVVAGFRRPLPGLERAAAVLFPAWFVFGYVALSFVELKEARHGVILLVPIAIWAAVGLACVLRPLPEALRGVAGVGCAALLAVATMLFAAVPQVDGYREAARVAAGVAPARGAVLFSGKRDGSFIFAMRTATGRDDLMTVRADKLFLSVAVRRELGVRETSFSDEQIRDLLRDVGISVVVAQRDFWTDLGQMAALQRVLDGPDFDEIDRIPVVANVPVEDHELRVYRARWDPRPARRDLVIDLPIIGRSVQGRGAAP